MRESKIQKIKEEITKKLGDEYNVIEDNTIQDGEIAFLRQKKTFKVNLSMDVKEAVYLASEYVKMANLKEVLV